MREFSLRDRFLVAPLLALVVCSLLTAAFIYESRHQNALLSRITQRDLPAFNKYADVFVELTEQHTALTELLFGAAGIDEATLYDQAKQHLLKVQQAVREVEQAHDLETSLSPGSGALRQELSANAQAYQKGVAAAVGMATVNLALAPDQLTRANERFTAMNRSFVKLLDLDRERIGAEIAARVGQSEARGRTIAYIGAAVAGLLFLLSLLLSRLLSRSLATQIGILNELGNQAGVSPPGQSMDELGRMTQAITAFRQSLLELRESARRFSDMLGNVALISVMLDREARITYCNESLLRLTGWRLEEVIGKNWFELFIPAEWRDPKDGNLALLAGEPQARHHENEILTRSGERRLIRWNNSVLRSTAGNVTGTASIGEDITERNRTELRIKRLNRVYAVLSGITALTVRARNRDELFNEACRIVVEAGRFTLAWIGVVDRRANVLIPVAWAGPGREYVEKLRMPVGDTAPDATSLVAEALRGKRAIIVNDIAHDSRVILLRVMLAHGLGSMVVLPLIVDGEALATLTLVATEIGFFDEAEMKLLLELADNIRYALDHMQKEQKVRRLTRVQAVLSGINTLIVRVRDREELFREACRIAVEAGNFRMCWLGLVERGSEMIVPVASAGSSPEHMAFIRNQISLVADTPAGDNLVAHAVRAKKPLFCNDTQNDPGYRFREEHIRKGTRSVVVLPLLVADEVAGVLALYSDEIGFFDDEELKLLTELAGDIAFAMDHIGKQEQLAYLAYYDALTGLANRTLFLERVAQYMRSAAGRGQKLALFLIDLERFKNINDSLGRTTGDALLKQVAEWLIRMVTDANLLARVGPDHFALVLPEVVRDGNITHLLEKMIAAFLEHPFCPGDTAFRIAAKVGVAQFPEDGADAENLFRNAEVALKKSKASGDRYLFYTHSMNDRVAETHSLESKLRQALEKNEFVLHYQPKVDTATRRLVGLEALIRWQSPELGLVPPMKFIALLEETGLILPVGSWALRQASLDHRRWIEQGFKVPRVAVNVSPIQLRQRDFVGVVEQAIMEGVAPTGIDLEITESLIMDDVRGNIEKLKSVRGLGLRIAIDDFGTGFSSLSYLARLPVDTLKIDRSFVIDMTASAEGLSLVSTIINLAHSLKLTVVAEGVETEEQARMLRLLNCDEMQGFLVSKPLPPVDLESRYLVPHTAGTNEPVASI